MGSSSRSFSLLMCVCVCVFVFFSYSATKYTHMCIWPGSWLNDQSEGSAHPSTHVVISVFVAVPEGSFRYLACSFFAVYLAV